MTFSCWQLAEFNLKGQIALSEKIGLIRICHADDGTLMLVGKDAAAAPAPGKPVAIQFAGLDSILGFVLDIGIGRTKHACPLVQAEAGAGGGAVVPRSQSTNRDKHRCGGGVQDAI